jgi:hypothetical protein
VSFHVPNDKRITNGPFRSREGNGNNGAFKFYIGKMMFFAIASDGGGWEHVSVSTLSRVPTWDEMCAVKSLFWDEEDCVVQFHPPRSQYVNNSPNCLHLWRKVGSEFEMPPTWMVGVR